MWRDFPNLRLQVVELDPEVVERRVPLLRLPRDERLRGRHRRRPPVASTHDERWDVIALDAFYSDSIPFHLDT